MNAGQRSANPSRCRPERLGHGQVHVRRHLAQAGGFGGEVTARHRRRRGALLTGSAVKITERGEGQGPAVGAPGQVLLAEGQVVAVALPADQGEGDVAEPGLGQRLRSPPRRG